MRKLSSLRVNNVFLSSMYPCMWHACVLGWMNVYTCLCGGQCLHVDVFLGVFSGSGSMKLQLANSASEVSKFPSPCLPQSLTNSFRYPVSVSKVPRLHECWHTHFLKVMLEFQILVLGLMRQEIYHYAFFPEPSVLMDSQISLWNFIS